MNRTYLMRAFAFIAIILFSATVFAQHGEIRGTVKDKTTGEALPFVVVGFSQSGTLDGAQADENGFYKIKPVNPGTYNVKFSFMGYDSLVYTNVLVRPGELVTINAEMNSSNVILPGPVIMTYREPLTPRNGITQITTIQGEDLIHSIDKDPKAIAAKAVGAFSADDNKPIFIRGSRSSATKYIVDGIPVDAEDFDVPGTAIEQVSVITGGVPAMFGDATGGIIIVTTKSYRGN